jgi:hypothetical protein
MVLSFTPPGLWVGLAMAGLGAIVIAVLLLISSRRRRLTP